MRELFEKSSLKLPQKLLPLKSIPSKPLPFKPLPLNLYSCVNTISAMWRERLIEIVSLRWCFAQLPVMRLGKIFPRSDTNLRSLGTSL